MGGAQFITVKRGTSVEQSVRRTYRAALAAVTAAFLGASLVIMLILEGIGVVHWHDWVPYGAGALGQWGLSTIADLLLERLHVEDIHTEVL